MNQNLGRRHGDDEPLWLTTRQAATLVGTVTSRTVAGWCRDGLLPARRIGGRWYVDRQGLLDMLSRVRGQ